MEKNMDTYPEWSSDGKTIYFCRAPLAADTSDYKSTRYNLYRIAFDPENNNPGEPELIFDADSMGKSVAFPRISPDGRFLAFTLSDYGCFPIWHKEADLWMIDLTDMRSFRSELNSDLCESYHSWSSNGKWLVFSSKRDDGLTARPYISFIDGSGKASKPFILPQKDPDFYKDYLKSFNIPEFSTFEVRTTPGMIKQASHSGSIQAKWRAGRVTSVLPVYK
jgi:Tol biopolymer transport system component